MKHGASGNLLCIRWFVSVSLTETLEVSWINSKTEYEKSLFSASQWKRIICVNCCYNSKKIPTSILLAKYLCYLFKRNWDYFKLRSDLMLEEKKDCRLREDNKPDTFHLSIWLKFSFFFWCLEGARLWLDTFFKDCNFFIEDCRSVTSLLLQLESSTGLTSLFRLAKSYLKANQVARSRALSQVVFLLRRWIVPSEWHSANMPLVYLMVSPLLPPIPYQVCLILTQSKKEQAFS